MQSSMQILASCVKLLTTAVYISMAQSNLNIHTKFYIFNQNIEHPEKLAERDMRVIAQHLSRSKLITQHNRQTVKHEAVNALAVGAVRIASNAIVNFNKTACSINDRYLEGEGELDN